MAVDKKTGYYDAGGIEVFDVLKAKLTEEQYVGYLLGTSIVYQLRCNWKEDFNRDIEKSKIYSEMLDKFNKSRKIKTNIKNNIDNIKEIQNFDYEKHWNELDNDQKDLVCMYNQNFDYKKYWNRLTEFQKELICKYNKNYISTEDLNNLY